MAPQPDAESLTAMALRRVRRGGVARIDGALHERGAPIPPGLLADVLECLIEEGLQQTGAPDEYHLERISLTGAGQARYLELCQARPTPLPSPEHAGAGQRWQARFGDRTLPRSEHILGQERARIAERLGERYANGATIRDLVAQTGRSYGWVRTLLLEAGVELDSRGGDRTRSRHG